MLLEMRGSWQNGIPTQLSAAEAIARWDILTMGCASVPGAESCMKQKC